MKLILFPPGDYLVRIFMCAKGNRKVNVNTYFSIKDNWGKYHGWNVEKKNAKKLIIKFRFDTKQISYSKSLFFII